jgi:phosphoglycolate phosphatase-like HAD superfamily hydrolase
MATESPGNFLFGIPDRLGFNARLGALADWVYRLGLRNIPQPFSLVPGVYEILDTLKSRYPMAIVSVRGARSTGLFLEQFNLVPYFQCIVTSQSCKHTKPYPDPILFAADQMGVPPKSCLMIGDTTVDMRAGKAAGAQTAGVLCGFGEEDELLRAGADIILASTAQLLQLLNLPP